MNGRTHLQSLGLLLLLSVLSIVLAGCSTPEERIEKRIAQAQELIDADRHGEAAALLRDLHAEWPENLETAELLAFAEAGNKNPAAAADAFLAAALLAPERSELLLFAAQARETAMDPDKAADHYKRYIAQQFDDPTGWRALARLESGRGNRDAAINALRNLYRLDPSGKTASEIGDHFLSLRNPANAHQWFTTALEKHPEEAGAAPLLGLLRIAMEEENLEQAENLAEQLDSGFRGAIDAAGYSSFRAELGQWRKSVEELKQKEEQAALALRRAEEAAKAEQERLEQERIEEEERAAREIAQTNEAEKAAATPENNPPETETETETTALPEITIAETIVEPPPPGPFETLLAEAAELQSRGRHGSAADTFWRALAHDDSDAAVWFELSRSLYRTQAWNDAELTILEALRRDPNNERYHLHHLNIIGRSHPVRTYIRELERVHASFPENPAIVFALAKTYSESLHSQAVALHYYRLFLRLAPNDSRRPEAEAAIRRLDRL